MNVKGFTILLTVLLITGCSSPPPPSPSDPPPPSPPEGPSPIPFHFTEENFPRIDGSTANIPLGQMIYAALLGKSAEEAETFIHFNGTAPAWYGLTQGEVDLLLAYEPSQETVAWLSGYTKLTYAPIGRDALVFLVNAQNKVDGLTAEQLRDIYSGAVANWKEVGGEDAAIAAYQRNAASGSQAMMEKLVMQGTEMDVPPQTMLIGDMGGLVDAVALYTNAHSAVGYNVYYYVSQMKNDPNVKLLAVNGAAPDNTSIQSGAYPFVNDFFVAIRESEQAGSPARILYEWLQSADGQALVAAAGYVPAG